MKGQRVADKIANLTLLLDENVDDDWLRVNIRLPDPELVAILEERCAAFGTVKFIRLLPVASDNLHRFAFVHMSTLTENMDLAAAAGGSTLGHGAVALCLEADF